MNKQFTFSIRKNGSLQRCAFSAPVEGGYVITNNYCPNALIVGEGSMFSQIVIPQNGETEDEFIQDCQNIVNKSNSISDNDVFFLSWSRFDNCSICSYKQMWKAIVSRPVTLHGLLCIPAKGYRLRRF